ncbi:oligosaccharide flippase family protein [Pseudomonas sp. PD9R]|uniref:oligosaccharide flippase family protein n=1 Tax=Pseudomonas sp. PD9R TaxID=2853534 RepID=UPI001C45FF87|nr:oligosaccharide flippase family protein [Pseudomonas sp. PD9R]MBV6824255.1 oligosaccharide flippase family protein [Pseudomonas sp. PD9R]
MMRSNIISNFLGQGWSALISLAFVPIYIKYLGIESYGLIGLFTALQAWLTILDMGMAPTLSREMARHTGGAHSAKSIWDLLRSIEFLVCIFAVIIICSAWGVSGWLAEGWLKVDTLPLQDVSQSLFIMGVVASLRLIENVYRSSLVGLQQQVVVNLVGAAMATLRSGGAVLVLIWVQSDIRAFFIWQGVASILTVLILSFLVYKKLPSISATAQFSVESLRQVGSFAVGMMLTTFFALLLTQADKIILSKILSLSEFGSYTFAALISSGLFMFVMPITQAFFPRFSELYAQKDISNLSKSFHQGAQLVTVLLVALASTLIFFGVQIITLWTQNPQLAEKSAPLVSILAMGSLLNGLLWIPYQAQLAHGWTSLGVRVNAVAALFVVPAIIVVAPVYGGIGAAYVWLVLNIGYIAIGMSFMFRRILTEEKWRWFFEDVCIPAAVGFGFVWLASLIDIDGVGGVGRIFFIVGVCGGAVVACSLAAPLVRRYIVKSVALIFN